MDFFAKDFGIVPQAEIGKELTLAFQKMACTDGSKTLIFEKGVYRIDTDSCEERMLYITNTVGDNEFSDGETPHRAKVALYLDSIKDLVLCGNGSTLIIDGKCTNIAAEYCENITFDGFEIDVVNPALHVFTVEQIKGNHVIFSLNGESQYVKENGNFYLLGKGYRHSFYRKGNPTCPVLIRQDNLDHAMRVRHPFSGGYSIKEVAPYKFKVYYLSTNRFAVGDRYYLFNTRRENVGIFVNSCKNFTLRNFSQRFNYSLALVCQKTENITVDNVDFSSDKRLICSVADFMQICNCKGTVSVTNSNFCGACDDAINVHGIHLYVEKTDGSILTLRFRHPQTHGFNPFFDGDEIEFVDRYTLQKKGSARIISSRLVNEQTVEIEVDNTDGVTTGMAVEDITLCPDFYYKNNTVNRITTRHILVTTRGRVLIENNRFLNAHMATILLSDDAKSWYESGPCRFVTIRDNYFGESYDYFVSVLPENGENKNIVHRNITIENNTFEATEDKGISIKCADTITIRNNKILSSARKNDFVKLTHCKNVVCEQQQSK